MNKTQLAIPLLSLCCLQAADAWGAPIGRSEALLSAKSFFESRADFSRAEALGLAVNPSRSGETVPYHIFNLPAGGGFIVISGDDRARTVLAYSDSGSLDPESMPAACSAWLDFYAGEINSLSPSDALTGNDDQQTDDDGDSTPAIGPLLTSKWGQGYPYNAKCPVDTKNYNYPSLTGCVATATAQIMYHYRHPLNPTGTVEYRDNTQEADRKLDLSAYTFAWDNMQDTYNLYPTTAQKNAIADLMLCTGYACKMQYGYEVSIAYHKDAAKALMENFGYTPDIHFYKRDFIPDSDWSGIILAELKAGRPVIYDGHGDSGGHTFVCDGYDGHGLFHFNWGWNGDCDGFYQLSALTPGEVNYTQNQAAICYILPAGSPESRPQTDHLLGIDILYAYTTKTVSYADGMNLSGKAGSSGLAFYCWNNSLNDFSGDVSATIESGGSKVVLSTVSAEIPAGGYKWLTFPVASSVPDGSYKVSFSYTLPGETATHKIYSKTGQPHEAGIDVKGFDVTYGPESMSGLEFTREINHPEIYNRDGHIDILSPQPIASATLTDISGRVRLRLTDCGRQTSVDVSSLNHGIYILEICPQEAAATVKKIIL